jgi:hypothetical protein
MITDALLAFVPVGTNTPILGAAVRSNVYDILGTGVGTPPSSIIGTPTLFGSDLGIGGKRPMLEVLLGAAAFAGGTSLNIAFQAAVDTAGTHVAGTWNTLVETGAILTANLTAAQVCARFDWPPAFPPGLNARYLSLLFTPVGTFTAGTINAAIVTMVRDDQANRYAAKNFTVA